MSVWKNIALALALVTAAPVSAVAEETGAGDEEPSLPAGLDDDEPGLPAGLGDEEPALPGGLEGDGTQEVEAAAASTEDTSFPLSLSGFFSLSGGARVQEDPDQKRSPLGEARLQMRVEGSWLPMSLKTAVAADFIFDAIVDEYEPNLETGMGAVDLREASIAASPTEWADLKVGRQVLTWGTGDLLFINDLFPKDWNAFLIGHDMEYLKAPSDAVKLALFSDVANLDIVYTPRFDADRFPDRRRLSSWDPMTQDVVGRDVLVEVDQPDRWFRDDEIAARLYRRIGRTEVAAYGYRGYWKSPAGFDPMTGEATFPELSVYGASARRPLLGGIANVEGGFYDSRSDRLGTDPMVRNSEGRVLVGYERELVPELTLGLQYYAELMRHYGNHVRSQPEGVALADERRQLVSMRLTWLAMSQSLRASFFGYYSPTDQDAAFFPSVSYAIDDHWKSVVGANLFVGDKRYTFFGQLEDNSSVFTSLRYAW